MVEQYRGKKIEEIYPNHEVVIVETGKFMKIIWREDNFPCNLNLLKTKDSLMRNLKTVYYIGDCIEQQLFKRGIKTLNDLLIHLKYKNSARKVLDLINCRDYKNLCYNRYIYDLDVLFCFDLEELLFLDIETLGLYDSPIIIVGLGFFKEGEFEIHQYFAKDLEDEIAICDYLRNQILPRFKTFITYNGKSFDIPYIANRFLYYFDENPMISDEDEPYQKSNTIFHHVDLYWNCRRKFKGQFQSYTLTSMEEELLAWKRANELPSNLVGVCYKKYKKDPERYVGLIKEIIEHNYYDLYSMPLILNKLLNSE
ncbi:MAG: ribonuclease H-like domain-containing protein [Promethearchaeota archaeon]